jgi:hypothetical protein
LLINFVQLLLLVAQHIHQIFAIGVFAFRLTLISLNELQLKLSTILKLINAHAPTLYYAVRHLVAFRSNNEVAMLLRNFLLDKCNEIVCCEAVSDVNPLRFFLEEAVPITKYKSHLLDINQCLS